MPEKLVHFVLQFEKRGRRLSAKPPMIFGSSEEALNRAERDAARFAGVVAVSQTVDDETGEVVDEPVILARYGELPFEFSED